MHAHVLIATPAFGDTVALTYAKSLFALQNHLRRNDVAIDLTLGTITAASVDTARNYFATHVLENPAYTHLLFIDADHGYKPDLILDMLALDEPGSERSIQRGASISGQSGRRRAGWTRPRSCNRCRPSTSCLPSSTTSRGG